MEFASFDLHARPTPLQAFDFGGYSVFFVL